MAKIFQIKSVAWGSTFFLQRMLTERDSFSQYPGRYDREACYILSNSAHVLQLFGVIIYLGTVMPTSIERRENQGGESELWGWVGGTKK